MIDLSNARILISNDDGINAAGIKILEQIARELTDDVWVVAPETEHSGAGHSLTLRKPLRIRKSGENQFFVDGTPTDCVLLALNNILKDKKPTLVLSGVNRGGNLGEDVTYSGTIAAAMEATLLGVPAIALSQFFEDRKQVKWETALKHGADIIRKLCAQGWPKNTLMNVNFPDCLPESVKGVKVATQGRRKIGDDLANVTSPWGEQYYWIGTNRNKETYKDGCDLQAVMDGFISVTPIQLDFTDYETLAALQESFK